MPSPETSAPAAGPTEVRLRDLKGTEDGVIVIGRIVSAERREVTRRSDGGKLAVLSGLLSDGTATVRFTWWDPPREPIERGTVLRAGPVQVREYRGRPEVSFGYRTRVEPASEHELPRLSPDEIPLRTTSELADGSEGFRIRLRVVRVSTRSATVGEERRQLHEGLLLDAAGPIAFTAWMDFGLRPDETIEVHGASVGSVRGHPRLTLDEHSAVRRIPAPELPTLADWEARPPEPIEAVGTRRGGPGVVVEGTVVGLVPPSGVVYRCTSCARSLKDGVCRVHGPVAGTPDLRLRLALDDGSGVLTLDADRPVAEAIGGVGLTELLERLRLVPDPAPLEQLLFERTFGRRLRAEGRASADEYGVTLYPDRWEPARTLSGREAALRARLGGDRA